MQGHERKAHRNRIRSDLTQLQFFVFGEPRKRSGQSWWRSQTKFSAQIIPTVNSGISIIKRKKSCSYLVPISFIESEAKVKSEIYSSWALKEWEQERCRVSHT